MKVDIVRDEQIRPSIAVIVTEGSAGRPTVVAAQSSLLGDIRKRAVAIVAVENDSAEAGHQQIRTAIIVVVADSCAHCPAGIANAGLVRDVRERAIVIVVVERTLRLLPGQRHLHACGVREVDIRIAVLVVIDQRYAAAHRLDDVARIGRRHVVEVNAGAGGDIHQLRRSTRLRRGPARWSRLHCLRRLAEAHRWRAQAS